VCGRHDYGSETHPQYSTPAHAGCIEEYADFFIGPVHVEDVALAHILLYENPSASGRHLCVDPICHWSDFASKVAELYPGYKVPK
jgi:dTDP-4-dehydrorhamnose reductase